MNALDMQRIQKENRFQIAVRDGASAYFSRCRARVPAFCEQHFALPGTWATNRAAFGLDIVRAPLNLFWAPIYALICLVRYLVERSGRFPRFVTFCKKIPPGFTTQVQKNLSDLLLHELLQHQDEDNSLKANIVHSLQKQVPHHDINQAEFDQAINLILDDALQQYKVTRTASADINNTVSCTIAGAFAFKKFTPGGIGVGLVLASLLAQECASRDFIFGKTLGDFYYSLFPPEPGLGLLSASMLAVMTLLAAFAAFSGLLTDPIQHALGLHQRRLHKMIDQLERDFNEQVPSRFRPKDQFIARILDGFDFLRASFL